jgi:hypothetical protein
MYRGNILGRRSFIKILISAILSILSSFFIHFRDVTADGNGLVFPTEMPLAFGDDRAYRLMSDGTKVYLPMLRKE